MRRTRIHDNWSYERADKVILFVAFVVGTAGTIALKLMPVPILVVALFPVGVLVAYVAACLSIRSFGTEPETIGDNSYYLGFLFTLASLAVTLFRIRDIDASDAELIPLVISGFGVALSSTIAGVFLRVFLLQLRPDIVARDREARRDLSAGARDLRDSMAVASRHLKGISVETAQHVAERNGLMSSALDAQLARSSELLERQAGACDEIIRELGQRMSAEVTTVLREEAKAAAVEISAGAKSASAEMAEGAKALRAELEAAGKARAGAEAELRAGIKAFGDLVAEARAAMTEQGEAVQAGYATLATRSKEVSGVLAEASGTAEKSAAVSRRVVEEAQRMLEESRARAHAREEEIGRHTDALVKSFGDLEARIAAHAASVTAQPERVVSPPRTASAGEDEASPRVVGGMFSGRRLWRS